MTAATLALITTLAMAPTTAAADRTFAEDCAEGTTVMVVSGSARLYADPVDGTWLRAIGDAQALRRGVPAAETMDAQWLVDPEAGAALRSLPSTTAPVLAELGIGGPTV